MVYAVCFVYSWRDFYYLVIRKRLKKQSNKLYTFLNLNCIFLNMKIKNKLSYILIGILFFNVPSFSDEKNNGINFYTGMFDFSDDGKRSVLIWC